MRAQAHKRDLFRFSGWDAIVLNSMMKSTYFQIQFDACRWRISSNRRFSKRIVQQQQQKQTKQNIIADKTTFCANICDDKSVFIFYSVKDWFTLKCVIQMNNVLFALISYVMLHCIWKRHRNSKTTKKQTIRFISEIVFIDNRSSKNSSVVLPQSMAIKYKMLSTRSLKEPKVSLYWYQRWFAFDYQEQWW